MGNSLRGEECNVALGNHGTIDMIKEDDESDDDGGYNQAWTMSYNICDSTCKLYLEEFVDERDKISEVFLKNEDNISIDCCYFRLWINRVQTSFLNFRYHYHRISKDVMYFKSNQTFNSHGCITNLVFCYGREGKGGLIVVDGKKRSKEDKDFYAITVAHYCAISCGNMFTRNKIDIGLSMVVNVHSSHGSLNYTVKGPDQHPSAALFDMFEQVCRNWTWKFMAGPHCAKEDQEKSSEIKHKDDIHKNILPTNIDGLRSSNSTNTKLGKSTQFVQDVTTHTVNKTNQSQPSSFDKQSRALESIENHDINGNGNGNRIGRDQNHNIYTSIRKIVNIFL